MTRTTPATIAVAADYADAMMTARRAKNITFLLLAIILIAQLALFFLVHFDVLKLTDSVTGTIVGSLPTADISTSPATAPYDAPVVEAKQARASATASDFLRYFVPLMDFAGVVLGLMLVVMLLLLVAIMLVGRLIGVSHVTSAFIWAVFLVIILFPWQAFLLSNGSPATATQGPAATLAAEDQHPAFKIPGVLYTWPELRQDYHFNRPGGQQLELLPAALKWARFVAAPVFALLILLVIQAKSRRGLKFALGEADVQVEVVQTTV